MKVYVVGDEGPGHSTIRSVHRTYEGSLKAWDELRTETAKGSILPRGGNQEQRDVAAHGRKPVVSRP